MAKTTAFIILLAGVALWSWREADMHSENAPYRRLAVGIAAVLLTLVTFAWYFGWLF